jgi:hypothetical protein
MLSAQDSLENPNHSKNAKIVEKASGC